MYHLLLVDDEAAVVKGLAYDIDWFELGVTEVFKAYSAEQALRQLEQSRIDIVITDISMPERNGIELASAIRERWPAAAVIFLSGHDDFDYARRAIELGVFHYATKPVDYGEIREKVREAVDKLERELIRDRTLAAARESLAEIRPLLQERLLHAWVVKGTASPLSSPDKFASAGLFYQEGHKFAPVVFRLDNEGALGEREPGVLELTLKELAAEWLLQGGRREGVFFESELGQWVLLLRENSEEECAKALRLMEEMAEPFKESVKRTTGCVVSVFFGFPASAGDVAAAYRKLGATVRRTVADEAGIILSAERSEDGHPAYERLEKLYEAPDLSLLLDTLELDKALERVELIFQELERKHPISMTALLEVYHVVSSVVIQASLRHGLALSQWAGDNERMLYPFMASAKVTDLKRWCLAVVTDLTKHLRTREKKQTNRLAEQAKQLVEAHYAREISVAEIASYLYVHPNYLSRVFKSETGLSLMDYISKRRIEEAKGLLAQPGFKVYEVAERVGYESIAHFNRMFKRVAGMSPKDYQRMLTGR